MVSLRLHKGEGMFHSTERTRVWLCVAAIAVLIGGSVSHAQRTFPMGMNIQGLSYWGQPVFSDVMTGTSNWITYKDSA